MKEFIRVSGVLPHRVLADKGTELQGIKGVMEQFRRKKDGNQPLVVHSATGTPILFVESVNAHVQRRLQVHSTQTSNVEVLLSYVCQQINNQPRKDKGNLSPIQLLSLNREQRGEINRNYKDRAILGKNTQKPLEIGQRVRYLMLTRKEQVSKLDYKGFAPKWSKTIHTVLKKTAVRGNKNFNRYWISNMKDFKFRHELLPIPDELDKSIPRLNKDLTGTLYEGKSNQTSSYTPPPLDS